MGTYLLLVAYIPRIGQKTRIVPNSTFVSCALIRNGSKAVAGGESFWPILGLAVRTAQAVKSCSFLPFFFYT